MTDRVTTERDDHVFKIGLNRPEKYNAFDLQMLRELAEAVTEYEDDDDLWCAVLYGHGDHFTSGLDLAEVGPAVASGEQLFPEGSVDPLNLHGRRRTKPLVQAVHGYCFTIGMELLMASEIAVAARDTTFGQIEVCRGIMPFGGATMRFQERCGWGDAMRYLLTGDKFDGEEAYRIRFVQELTDTAEGAVARAFELAHNVASQAPLAVQASLKSANITRLRGEDAALEVLMDDARSLMTTNDAMEGMQSFMERRDAEFTGS